MNGLIVPQLVFDFENHAVTRTTNTEPKILFFHQTDVSSRAAERARVLADYDRLILLMGISRLAINKETVLSDCVPQWPNQRTGTQNAVSKASERMHSLVDSGAVADLIDVDFPGSHKKNISKVRVTKKAPYELDTVHGDELETKFPLRSDRSLRDLVFKNL